MKLLIELRENNRNDYCNYLRMRTFHLFAEENTPSDKKILDLEEHLQRNEWKNFRFNFKRLSA